mmetsp:Transcript_27045/g.58711  ORF Transcript_27045/g.58711 Transcript_27045/m.58711 type:complete len:163 (+) Transcript_27045:259-747(+)
MTWMASVNLTGISYVGTDIVEDLVESHRDQFRDRTDVTFETEDLVVTAASRSVDLILCRDALMHLPHRDVMKTLRGFSRSGSRYLLTTSFALSSVGRENTDLLPGEFTPLDLTSSPFHLHEPLEWVDEALPEDKGSTHNDAIKRLGLWRLPVIQDTEDHDEL